MLNEAGYSSYQDPRLQPPDEPDPTPAECWEWCIHGEVCRMHLERLYGRDVDEDRRGWKDYIADELGCSDCEYWEE